MRSYVFSLAMMGKGFILNLHNLYTRTPPHFVHLILLMQAGFLPPATRLVLGTERWGRRPPLPGRLTPHPPMIFPRVSLHTGMPTAVDVIPKYSTCLDAMGYRL
jgi:hypothetical protein